MPASYLLHLFQAPTTRKDRYENVMLYYVERSIKATMKSETYSECKSTKWPVSPYINPNNLINPLPKPQNISILGRSPRSPMTKRAK